MSHYLKSQQRRIDAAFAVAGKTAVAPLKPAARRQGRAAKPRGKPRAS